MILLRNLGKNHRKSTVVVFGQYRRSQFFGMLLVTNTEKRRFRLRSLNVQKCNVILVVTVSGFRIPKFTTVDGRNPDNQLTW